MNYRRNLLVLIVLLLSTIEIFAGGKDRMGTSSGQQLLIPVGARGVALGGSNLSSISGIDAIFWNPAGVSGYSGSLEAMFSSMSYIADINMSAVALTTNIADFGSIGLSLRTLSFGEIPYTTELLTEAGWETFSPSFTVIGLTFAKSVTDRIRVGFTANIINETMMRTGATSVGFDIGIQYFGLGGLNGLKLGLVIRNLGPQMTYSGNDLIRMVSDPKSDKQTAQPMAIQGGNFELPSHFELGLGYEANLQADHKLSFGTSFCNNNFSADEYKLNVEYAFQDLFFVRGSYQMAPTDTDEYLFGPALGAGIHYNTGGVDLSFDYAYRDVKTFSANHTVTMKVGF